MMDYFQWCERVLAAYLEAAQYSLEVRRDGLPPEQVARRIFGPEVVEQDRFMASSDWEGLKQAIKDLDDEGYIWTEDYYYGDEPHLPARITREGEEFLEGEESRWTAWWVTCTSRRNLKQEQRDLLELVHRLSPRQKPTHAWMEWIHQESLCGELGWEAERLRLVIEDIRASHDFIKCRPNYYPLGQTPPAELHVRETYKGLVLQTKCHLTLEAREIDDLVEEWETTSVEFKQELETRTKDQKAEFVKDVLGLVNTKAGGERWLIVGFEDETHTYHSGCTLPSRQDDLEQILSVYADPMVEIRYDIVEYYHGPVGRLRILRDPAKLPYRVGKSIGDKKRIEEDQVFVRHGSQTEEPTDAELQALLEESRRARAASQR
jgi:Schlafen, AlbA_2